VNISVCIDNPKLCYRNIIPDTNNFPKHTHKYPQITHLLSVLDTGQSQQPTKLNEPRRGIPHIPLILRRPPIKRVLMMPVMEALPIREDRHEVVVGGEDVFVPRPAAEPVAD
jgi:hypothetical protein